MAEVDKIISYTSYLLIHEKPKVNIWPLKLTFLPIKRSPKELITF
jgi:hypothetical protein